MEDSLLRDFTVRLDKEEVQLIKELDSVQEKIIDIVIYVKQNSKNMLNI